MTGSPTTQGTSATELTERDGSPARSGHQFDSLANASNRAPRLVATKVENISVEPSGKAPLPATKRSRPRPAHEGHEGQGQARGAERASDGFRRTHPAGGRSGHPGAREPRLCPCCSSRTGDRCRILFSHGHG